MKRTIGVFIGTRPQSVGMIRYEGRGSRESASFEYSAAWPKAADRFAIDPALPLVTGPQFHRKSKDGSIFHSAIADVEPDGWGRRVILRDHAKRRSAARLATEDQQPHPLNALDFLLTVDDSCRVGALRFQDEEGIFQCATEPGRSAAPPMIELKMLLAASRAVENNTESAADLAYLRGRGSSLGGLRPKCTVVDDRGRLSIGKFPSIADERAVTKGEVLAMHLAKIAGVSAAETGLVESAGTPVALIRRFDRAANGERLMYVSAATMLGAETDDPGEYSYTELVDILRVHGAAAQADIEELWRRIAFSILITNTDDHLHNHGFLHVEQGKWRLSPAFDLNPFPERVRELKTWISPDTGSEASVEALLSVAPYFRIPMRHAKEILGAVDSAVAGWRSEGRKIGMSSLELDQFADAFEHRERSAARRAAA